ncbi:Branched-chain amino acid transport system / permease component [Caprobacter fermentans]|uniref:Branched-chain amino acid transport system / permease component n=1 Tax=Caproicibacter fermentans TaxID=2576756 RepID=A0A6N8HW10_9FIRM|nr:ABC transporter permease [Caproicibacter fermentans]MVB09912.1 Branched-chain amino acid transport system / permease component [Caproicibacter fermentans]OCN00305.1 sugar ABC transporter permease [Clostridium sp. W14A]
MFSKLLLLIGITMMYSTPLVFGALGGVVSERSGVVNIGIEGMMTMGAFTGASVSYFTGNPWLGFLAAGVAGGLVALLHAIASVTFNADQTISGIAINLIGPGFALFFCRLLFKDATMTPPVATLPRLFGEDAFAGTPAANLNVDVTVVLGLIATVFIWFILYKTKWGLRIRSVGEHPAASDTLGINVGRTRYSCVLASGVLSGFGGASMTLAIISQFNPTAISGQGFIALAAVIFGKWTPYGAYGACLLFGLAQALTVVLGGSDSGVSIPSQILAMLPYFLTIVVLILFVGRSVAPKADGLPYEKGER